MRTTRYTAQFKRDYKRETKGRFGAILDESLLEIVELLANDRPLAPRHYDHSLSGNWKDHRDCHIKRDLVLIYRKPDAETLELVRVGPHSELF